MLVWLLITSLGAKTPHARAATAQSRFRSSPDESRGWTDQHNNSHVRAERVERDVNHSYSDWQYLATDRRELSSCACRWPSFDVRSPKNDCIAAIAATPPAANAGVYTAA